MEMIVVIILLGVMVGMSVASYNVTLERNYEKVGMENLRLIHSAQKLYKVRVGDYWQPGSLETIVNINSDLNINLIENNMTYYCISMIPNSYDCLAGRNPCAVNAGVPSCDYALRVNEMPLDTAVGFTNPGCSLTFGGACPTADPHREGW